ncbi:MAG TPA: GNAT family N-acetyltransferase [Candidatus Bathyarchaeia archaeon]|nr:GNAT family N-acetyltransferase [Candidatus Bathyarchaeia archaeon]
MVAIQAPAEISLRRGGPDDRSYIVTLAMRAFADFGEYDEIISEWLDSPGVVSIIAADPGARCGFALVAPRRTVGFRRNSTAELIAIAVSEAARGRGVGRSLLERVELIARGWAAGEIRLHTAVSNAPARRFFGSAGFRVLDTADAFYPNGQRALELRKSLR